MLKKKCVFIDFDHTIMDGNSDILIKSLAGPGGIPNKIEALSKDFNGWSFYMSNIFKFLHERNISKDNYFNCLAEAPLVDGIKELLNSLHETGNCEIIILSDSNSFFINCILQYHQLSKVITDIFTNPAEFDADGCLQMRKFREKCKCSMCPDYMCKGEIVQNYISQKTCFDATVLYIGDGGNDLCPALKLTDKDYVFAREGYRLLKKLEKIPAKDVKPVIVPWKNGYDILKFIN